MKLNGIARLGMFAAVAAVATVGCSRKTEPETPGAMERAGAAADRAAERTGEAVRSAGEATKEATGRALERAGDALENAGRKMQEDPEVAVEE